MIIQMRIHLNIEDALIRMLLYQKTDFLDMWIYTWT